MYRYRTNSRAMMGDMLTPVAAYMKLRDIYPQSALMESSDYHGGDNSRSFIGLEPIASVSVSHGEAVMEYPGDVVTRKKITAAYRVEDAIGEFVSQFCVEGESAEYCGLYGYTTFNAVRYFEGIDVKDSREPTNDAPDILYILYKYIIVFNDFRHELMILEMGKENAPSGIDRVVEALKVSGAPSYPFVPVGEPWSTLTDDAHRANIRRGIAHCMRGDVFQIVLSRRFVQRYEGDDFNLYRALRSINPSPYLFYFDFGGFRIFGSSPETHCKVTGRRASIDPIAGTARRSGSADIDAEITARLLADPKENAEHVMLVDLARNDLSRNCHDVRVDFFKEPQYYSHVIHLVSRVSGTLDDGADSVRTFIDTFPAGTLSGAPKVRAMQLISEYEPHSRGAYGGCVGFIGLNGDINQAITIRTFVSRNGELWFQAGGGIVAGSNVENELQEVNNKLAALRKAIEIAADNSRF